MADLRDPEYAERLEGEAPDEYLRRRDFLARAALTVGLATGLGTALDADTLVAEAARHQRGVKLPSARNMPIDTIVRRRIHKRARPLPRPPGGG